MGGMPTPVFGRGHVFAKPVVKDLIDHRHRAGMIPPGQRPHTLLHRRVSVEKRSQISAAERFDYEHIALRGHGKFHRHLAIHELLWLSQGLR